MQPSGPQMPRLQNGRGPICWWDEVELEAWNVGGAPPDVRVFRGHI
jgi:hypothetical protein